jgi:hypothetical protein
LIGPIVDRRFSFQVATAELLGYAMFGEVQQPGFEWSLVSINAGLRVKSRQDSIFDYLLGFPGTQAFLNRKGVN